ncbi:MAG: uracil-DNA glycosylase [Candidatus Omnitrophica bacterium]|nr:uracil-DNA glycosylase [Candidatus Omnitrophota bacterium]
MMQIQWVESPTRSCEKPYEIFKSRLSQSNCRLCALSKSRTHIVVDRGNPESQVVFIGEAPGANEDFAGRAFVGRAGKMLDQMLSEIGLDSNRDIVIINTVKCRPPGNRRPANEELAACRPYLLEQIGLLKPSVIVLMGKVALSHWIEKKDFRRYKETGRFFQLAAHPGIDFFLIYHPAYLLYDPKKKGRFREDLLRLKERLFDAP